ncbi:hypothetical protein ACH3XW_17895 [Acanthocheilonema viteae]
MEVRKSEGETKLMVTCWVNTEYFFPVNSKLFSHVWISNWSEWCRRGEWQRIEEMSCTAIEERYLAGGSKTTAGKQFSNRSISKTNWFSSPFYHHLVAFQHAEL